MYVFQFSRSYLSSIYHHISLQTQILERMYISNKSQPHSWCTVCCVTVLCAGQSTDWTLLSKGEHRGAQYVLTVS